MLRRKRKHTDFFFEKMFKYRTKEGCDFKVKRCSFCHSFAQKFRALENLHLTSLLCNNHICRQITPAGYFAQQIEIYTHNPKIFTCFLAICSE